MLVLITGGSACGKSAHAENILCTFALKSRLYLATMEPYGHEGQQRILRHRALRAGKGFETIEHPYHLPGLKLEKQYDGVLLEDISNLLANEIFSPNGAGETAIESILQGITQLEKRCNTLVCVTNEIFSDGIIYDRQTMQYIKMLGEINTVLAARADMVAESVCGILVYLKGENFVQ